MGNEAAGESQERLRGWLRDNQRPEKPHREGRKWLAVLVVSGLAAVVAAVVTALSPAEPLHESDANTVATVTASHRIPGSSLCSLEILYDTGETGFIPQSGCASRGDVVMTTTTANGLRAVKREHQAARFAAAFINAVYWFAIVLVLAALATGAFTLLRHRRTRDQ